MDSLVFVIAFPSIFAFIVLLFVCIRYWMMSYRQKTRSPQQRRMYVGSRARPSLGQPEPTIFVSPSNLPPPPKYECMAPPSYEEVVGVHYPNYQVQPITQPIATALAQNNAHTSTHISDARSNDTVTVNVNNDETIVVVPRPIAASS